MAEKIEVYRASDGETFDSEAEADAHEALIALDDTIVEFASARAPKSDRERTRIRNTIRAWEAHRAEHIHEAAQENG